MHQPFVRTLSASLALAVLAACAAPPMVAPQAGSFSQAPTVEANKAVLAQRLMVGFNRMPSAAAISQIEKQTGTKVVKSFNKLALAVFETKGNAKNVRQSLLKVQGVQFVEAELLPEQEKPAVKAAPKRFGSGGKTDPHRADQWYLDKMGIPKVWAAAPNLKTVTVAVVDTGVDLKHPDLQGVLVEGYNAAAPGTPPQDDQGHGTMCAGLIGAVANNGTGIAGIAPNAKIMPVKVGNSASSIVEAMIWAADHADMITMSLSIKPGMRDYPSAVETTKRAAEYVMSKNVPMACSMGNTYNSQRNVPSAFAGHEVPHLIAVGATDINDKVTDFSTYGAWTSVAAPGRNIMTTTMGGGYGSTNGTSFSTPITAGVMALMLGKGIAKDPATIKAKLQQTAVDIETPGRDDKSGAGRVDAYRAVME